jgi:serine/threonine-protein kinase RsbW
MDKPDNIQLKKTDRRLYINAPGHCSSLRPIRAIVSDLAHQLGFSDGEVAKIEMAVDEACSNVLEHAYASDKEWSWKRDPEIRLEIHHALDRITILIHDHGQRFDFSTYRPTDILEHVFAMHPGGYGVAIMRQFMDEVHYSSNDAEGNTLRMVKYLKKS